MIKVAIPKFGRKQSYILIDENGNEHEIKIRGYRASDHELVLKLQKYTTELPSLMGKAKVLREVQNKLINTIDENNPQPEEIEKNFVSLLNDLDDDDFTDDEIQELMEIVQDIQEMEGEITKISYKLGQRGLKRALYKEDEDYREEYLKAEHENRLTKWIDKQEDIDVDMDHLNNIANIMIQLGMPNRQLPGSGRGKQIRV